MGAMFGAMGAQFADKEAEGAQQGLAIGSQIAAAEYNANAMKAARKGLEEQTRLQTWLLEKAYESDYRKLLSSQEQQFAWNQVVAQKRGITGESANATMQSYAMKSQRNMETLYYNTAMKVGEASMQNVKQIQALRERERQYRWQATMGWISMGVAAVAGSIKGAGTAMSSNGNTADSAFGKDDSGKQAQPDAWKVNSNSSWNNDAGGLSFNFSMS
jgi:hypothetical protein